jgi:hypothetical protein
MWLIAIGIAGDVINFECIVPGRYERTEISPIRPGQRIKDDPTFRTAAPPEMR